MEQESIFQEEPTVSPCERDYPGCPCLTCAKTPLKNGVLCCYKRHKLCGAACPDYKKMGETEP